MDFTELVKLSAHLFEGAGVTVMVAGTLLSVVMVLLRRHKETGESAFRHFRQKVGRSILLGLELLVAADIIRTVSEKPTREDVLVLGMIVLIRTFLSFTLAVELEGHWPWQKARYQEQEVPPLTPPPERPGTGTQVPEPQHAEH